MMPLNLSVPEQLERQIAQQVKHLHCCEAFLERATEELMQAPYHAYLQRRVKTIGKLVFNTKHTIATLEQMLKHLQ